MPSTTEEVAAWIWAEIKNTCPPHEHAPDIWDENRAKTAILLKLTLWRKAICRHERNKIG
jgi:hypothetical protein